MSEIKDTDWTYAAGFIDGEGCIAVTRSFVPSRNYYSYSVHVVVANNNRSVLDWMHETWGGWVVAVSSFVKSAHSRESFHWRAPTGMRSEPFLAGVRPYLKVKGDQCDNALAMIQLLRRSRYTLGPHSMPQAWKDEQERHYWIQRELNHRGSAPFEAKSMHSPRRIHRERAQLS